MSVPVTMKFELTGIDNMTVSGLKDHAVRHVRAEIRHRMGESCLTVDWPVSIKQVVLKEF